MVTKRTLAIIMLVLMLTMTLAPMTVFATNTNTNTETENESTLDDVIINEDGTITLSGEFAENKHGASGAWNEFIRKYRLAISGLSGVASVTFLVFFILNFMKLGASAGNSMKRGEALTGLVWTGIACAGLGGVSIFIGFFYHALS